jgi:hypothetical protein
MATSVYTSGLTSYGPTSPDAQGSYGQTAQPNSTSTTQATQTSTSTAPPASGTSGTQASPVNPDGTISAQSASTAAPRPAGLESTQPYYGTPVQTPTATNYNGWIPQVLNGMQGYFNPATYQWVPGDHPIATAAGAPVVAPNSPAPAVAPTPAPGAVPGTPTIDPTALLTNPAPTYTPYQFTQYGQQVDPWATQNAQAGDLITQMLAAPHTITDQGAGILAERQKAQALAQQEALLAALQQQQVASGFGTPGGYQQSQQRRIGEGTNTALLQGSQDLALARMQQDRQDEINALNAASGFMGQDAARQGTLYQSLLSGQNAQAGDNFRGYGSQADAFNNHQQVALSAQQLALQRALGQGGLDLDARRLGESGRQFDLGHQLNWASLMEQMLQGRLGYGMDLAGLQQNAQNNMFSQLFGGG